MQTASRPPLKVFISYSHKDESLKQDLLYHLAALKRAKKIEIWQDRQIDAGIEWNTQILEELDAADIILLLITARFIASDFCYSKEMNRALFRNQQGTARVIPIVMAPCAWSETPLHKLNALPTDGKPVTEWSNQDSAYTNIASGLSRVVNAILDSQYEAAPREDDGWATPPPQDSAPSDSETRKSANLRDETQKRLGLFQLLSNLPGPTFDSVVYALNVPPPLLPPAIAPQGQRVPALLNWAQSPLGCGLEELEAVVNSVINPG
ncbi:toll/interleukin-1 receptor domain-containing protein [Oscillatoria sp. CS-180]|uniref:toll/interleukin-1 receptor domain-containing protein n=1 Tax=Oscillatoria sp. CS-180 TaxID=3021720 RepID=UPI00232C467A|nr:toll/interleukin-1 receptor domain-containing protein [Oscillatoria sp. CS-180]MDB9529269.1 toll/interleukin-1 receptor domain-containing protein [Oscillatoria sp. CS-180]